MLSSTPNDHREVEGWDRRPDSLPRSAHATQQETDLSQQHSGVPGS